MSRSATHRAMGPGWSRWWLTGTTPVVSTRPKVGLQVAIPQYEAGRTSDPPVCVPIAPGHIPDATATAEPLLDPPGE